MKGCPGCGKKMVYGGTCKQCRIDKAKTESMTILLTINGNNFRCICNCNCFHKASEEERKSFSEELQDKDLYICNACGQSFEGS